MTTTNAETASSRLRIAIEDFLSKRLVPKLEKLSVDDRDKREKLLEEYQRENWIASAARRVSQIQQVTHALKFVHPDAKGSNLNKPGNTHVDELVIGTHTLADKYTPDVIGNAAALDVYKFLSLEVDGSTILSRACSRDERLLYAFSEDIESAESWMQAFATLVEDREQFSSHTLAKQIFWPLGDDQYHLLSPLFPSSLIHTVWTKIREDRFSDDAKTAREAHRNKQGHPHGYCEYPNTTLQKFGGTKPQNISQLNSQRYGENYLLPSVPPNWYSEPIRPPLNIESIFSSRFGRRPQVRELTQLLRSFLISVKDYTNIGIRTKRMELVQCISDQLLVFAAQMQTLPAGWSLHKECRLNMEEQYWLDPYRAENDQEFAIGRNRSAWREAVCQRYGNWLNARIESDITSMSAVESQQWRKELKKALDKIGGEVDING